MHPVTVLLVSALATATPPAGPGPTAGISARCVDHGMRHAAGSRTGGFQKLGDLPPANAYRAVDRHVDGCRRPVLIESRSERR